MPTTAQTNNALQTPNRVPPRSIESEETVIGTMIYDFDGDVIPAMTQTLSAADFYDPNHKTIFNAIYEIYQSGRSVNQTTLENYLSGKNLLKSIGGESVLVDLTMSASHLENAEYAAGIVKEKSKARNSLQEFQNLINKLYDPNVTAQDVLNRAEKFVYEQTVGERESGRTQLADRVMEEAFEYMVKMQESEGGITGLESGLPYDQVTTGYHPGKVYVVAGRPGMGKTAFMLQNLRRIAEDGTNVGILSLEMDNKSLGSRLICADAGVDNHRAYQGELNDNEMERLADSAAKLSQFGFVMDDTTDLSPSTLRIKARMMKQLHNIGILAIDYLQLMTSEKDVREQQIADISRTCKKLAKELNIPVVSLSQLSRQPDKRNGFGSRPQLSDLRESGAIEQDANVVMFLYRPEVYGLESYPDGSSTEGVTEVVIAKHRDGPTGLKKLYFEKETMTFRPLSTESAIPHPAQSAPVNDWYDTDYNEPF